VGRFAGGGAAEKVGLLTVRFGRVKIPGDWPMWNPTSRKGREKWGTRLRGNIRSSPHLVIVLR
jgi:hypothetical protein